MTNKCHLIKNALLNENFLNCKADKTNLFDKQTISLPAADHKGRIHTLNKMGYMYTSLDEISLSFIESSANAKAPVLEIGAAYGAASQRALANDAVVFANDIDFDHLCLLRKQVESRYWSSLYLDNSRFPDETNFPENSFSSILLCRVAHFLSGKEMEIGMKKIYRWLIPGGELFFLVLSPFHRRLKWFLSTYEQRWKNGVPWPGEMNAGCAIWPEFSEYIPEFLHVMDERPIKAIMEKMGFNIHRSELFQYGPLNNDLAHSGEYFGVIAVKKK
jgi:SAM-dependent methyltransferase